MTEVITNKTKMNYEIVMNNKMKKKRNKIMINNLLKKGKAKLNYSAKVTWYFGNVLLASSSMSQLL
jgi:hypothetical protein